MLFRWVTLLSPEGDDENEDCDQQRNDESDDADGHHQDDEVDDRSHSMRKNQSIACGVIQIRAEVSSR